MDVYICAHFAHMLLKLILFTLIISLPCLSYWLFIRKKLAVDYQLVLSYFIFGSWFGMCGEVFLDTVINQLFQLPIPLWEYRILPIHRASTSSYGPIMWGIASVCVCFFHHYTPQKNSKKRSKIALFLIESGFLMIAELYFDISGYFLFNEYFFYYFSPEFFHFSALVNVPFWWCGYKLIVKAGVLLKDELKFNSLLALLMIVITIWGF